LRFSPFRIVGVLWPIRLPKPRMVPVKRRIQAASIGWGKINPRGLAICYRGDRPRAEIGLALHQGITRIEPVVL
jgi:hypothetical protein